ncbi:MULTISPECIES: polysaccharide biosynthesis/export family protein [unclassified Sphingobium]|uniref:polysaccharide biosynthesis/export family protein n=1 Tax=unclassified Sphingobium TaxID=2611147 RepID=UPI000D17AA67|nr:MULTISPECIES: polysaccharide biosynthesis/export family protein [unclassified Sphingobium]PSO09733.1 capsule biosynthesis protein [Sphingobium sp. AEW4]TWD19058.1 polysaccharide export outer membrane protein [Sphingobium sp. AEW013]
MQVKNSVYLALLTGLAGCATLPSSGPTGTQIEKSATAPNHEMPIQLVQIQAVGDIPAAAAIASPTVFLADATPTPTDMVGPGDILDINIYEAGVTLFASSATSALASQGGSTPGVQVQKLPPTRIDDLGDITIPYAGTMHVAGLTTGEIETAIRNGLRRLSQNPQVIVTLSQAITNSIIIGGEVSKPGRLVLQTNRETLSDVIALAGGYRGDSKDLMVRLNRGGSTATIRVNDIVENPALDVRIRPGDRLMLVDDPRTYSILGASGRIEQVPFRRTSVSLAEAIANAGGTNPQLGDPAAIFLFRYVKDAEGKEMPMVYHVNMMQTGSYFLAQKFVMQDNDVLYFGNAAANQPSKLVQLISQLFSPVLTVTSAVSVIQR